jgi:hypothetical protein
LQTDAEALKNARSEQSAEAPVDLLTPWRVISNMKKTMATVGAKDRETLCQYLQAVIAQKREPASAAPFSVGQKLGKEIFEAVLMGDRTEAQVGTVMNAGQFRPHDRQAMLDDLNSLGPQGGGGHR